MSAFNKQLEKAFACSMADIKNALKDSVITRSFEKQFPKASKFQIRVDLLTTLGKVAFMDRDVSKLEREYIVKKSSKLLKDDDTKTIAEQLDLIANLVRRNIKCNEDIPYHVAHLLKAIGDNKERFFDIMIGLIASDGKLENREKYFVEAMANAAQIPQRKLNEMILDCHVKVAQFQEEESEIEPKESTQTYEVPTIKIDFD